jgi:hypothetical protein
MIKKFKPTKFGLECPICHCIWEELPSDIVNIYCVFCGHSNKVWEIK